MTTAILQAIETLIGYIDGTSDSHPRTVILITGANKGIGLDLSKLILQNQKNVSVILACRKLKRIVKYQPLIGKSDLIKQPELSEKVIFEYTSSK